MCIRDSVEIVERRLERLAEMTLYAAGTSDLVAGTSGTDE